MTTNDAVLLAPVIAAILVAAAILAMDFVLPGRKVPALIVTFAGLAIVAVLAAVVGQDPGGAFQDTQTGSSAYVVDPLTTFQLIAPGRN